MGLGLRQPHFPEIIRNQPRVPWFEVLADNCFGEGGRVLAQLEKVRSHYPVVFHCVGMNLGSVDPMSVEYFRKLKGVMERFAPTWVSDHLSWTAVSGRHHHDLLPLPYTEEVVSHVSDRILRAQEWLGRRILIENASSYVHYWHSEMTEWEFIREVARRSDCLLLLDVNNVYVNSVNQGFDPEDFLQGVPRDRVRQFHLAGYEKDQHVLIDTHGAEVSASVWSLYRSALARFGPVPTAIERDNAIPAFQELMAERDLANRWMHPLFCQ